MNVKLRKVVVLMIAAVIGGAATFGVMYSLQLFTFQTEFSKAFQTYRAIHSDYYQPVSADRLADEAIRGMLESLEDPYTEYLGAEESEEFFESAYGEFTGIGADIRSERGQIVVISPVYGSPAEKAGLLPGDIILAADGNRLDGLSLDQVARYIRGPKGSTVTLSILRSGEEFSMPIRRDTIPNETVIFTMLPEQIAVIKITEFSVFTGEEFEEALRHMNNAQAKGLILDLRQNSGGVFDRVVEVVSYFLDDDELIVTRVKRDGAEIRYVTESVPFRVDIPAVVLVDEGTASAAEVTAAALRDAARIPLVGRQTFGKGTVQKVIPLRDGTTLKYTMSELVTPGGYRFHDVGLTPDADVSLPSYARYPFLQVNRVYKLGETHQDIGLAQKYLEALEYRPGRTDGVLDQGTADAIKSLQTTAGLEPSGELDAETAAVMTDMLRKQIRDNDTQLQKGIEVLMERMGP